MEKVNPKLSNIVSLFRNSNCGHNNPLADFADHETNPSEEIYCTSLLQLVQLQCISSNPRKQTPDYYNSFAAGKT
jgi:hypothetical protein